ncbi:TIGR03663 family protein [Halobacterium salinarum]|uniref:Glycosyltransferase RgtA/B/C/D-like domain-containing protein n=6 Tax=Halobacterium salinarum TaxID=2242 RepID=Q9HRM4_HALSA|nr:flippase activity-associated protein Agl23 [Halobacterium salinarum]AAG19134.1 conserved hypothetical protein [Halobacterium salinarum NRC-1]MDL0120692.1 TIGR03663 family protein [Halobacterium salinarum]MDL0143787.1 TIGR03663 family protein [Halobacterium salinarum]CAP13402.1 TIGR03663 family protein [Halobacterium salinarum R1]
MPTAPALQQHATLVCAPIRPTDNMDSTGRDRRVVVAGAVAAVVAGALAARLAGLGARPFHADEARVGYWILDYHATGAWSYRPIVHGPFLFHVNDALFGLFGASDAVARAPVAVVGGLLPGVAWLFRGRLDDTEVIALAGLLAFTPTLVYYSRFMRSDVLVAAFSLAAVGFAVRAHDTGRRWLLPVAAGWLALALTAKENALVYAAMFAGAGALVADRRLLTANPRGLSWTQSLQAGVTRAARGFWAWRRTLAASAVVAGAVFVAFYTPRPVAGGLGAAPTRLPSAVAAGSADAAHALWQTWVVDGVDRDHSYIAYLVAALRTLATTAVVVAGGGVLGFLAERYAADTPRPLVLFAGYWGLASVVVYPAITTVAGAWSVTHAVVPLAIPAAVGIAAVVRTGHSAVASRDTVNAALAGLVLLAAVAQVGVVAAETSYVTPQAGDNPLVQPGQPTSDMHPGLESAASVLGPSTRGDPAAERGAGVVYVGDQFAVSSPFDRGDPARVAGTSWFDRLPLPWYLERANATVTSTPRPDAVVSCDTAAGTASLCDAPVVIAPATHYDELAPTLGDRGYDSVTYELDADGPIIVVFVDTTAPGYEPPTPNK